MSLLSRRPLLRLFPLLLPLSINLVEDFDAFALSSFFDRRMVLAILKRISRGSHFHRSESFSRRACNRRVSRRFVLFRTGVLWNEQRQIGITILEEGLDFLFPFPLEQRQEKTQPEGFPLSKSLAPSSMQFSSRVVPLQNYLYHFPSYLLFLSSFFARSNSVSRHRAFISPCSISGLEIHPILVHEDFNLVWSRYRHVLIFLSIFPATCSLSLRFLSCSHPSYFLSRLSLSPFLSLSLSLSLTTLSGRETFTNPCESKREDGRCLYRSVRTNRVQARRKFPVASAGNSRNAWVEKPFIDS